MRRGISGAWCAASPFRTFVAAQIASHRASDPAPLLSPQVASQNRIDMAALTKISKRSTLSAGILAYRKGARGLEVLLVHPGGPFWRNKDDGAWSIPKGEIDAADAPEQVARREFAEELGPSASIGPLRPLGEIRQRGGKRPIRANAKAARTTAASAARSKDATRLTARSPL